MANKLLGQHFLTCRWVLDALTEAASLTKKDTVLEVGPGKGVLTRVLAQKAARVIAVEKDSALAQNLTRAFAREHITNVKILSGDILKTFPSLISTHALDTTPYKVVANIPYYLTSRLIRTLLETDSPPECIVLTIQKEVAKRIMAKPHRMNLLALSIAAFGKAEYVKDVPKECFAPKPKVDSAVIHISDISQTFFAQHNVDKDAFFTLLRQAFSQKRKLLSSSLRKTLPNIKDILSACEFPEKARPEELSLDQWQMLYTKING